MSSFPLPVSLSEDGFTAAANAPHVETDERLVSAEQHYLAALKVRSESLIDKAVWHIENMGYGPLPDGAKVTFAEHLEFVTVFSEAQADGLRRGIPPIVITAMSKSGSASLTQTISEMLNVPIGNLSWSNFVKEGRIVPTFAKCIARGAAVTHEHYSATPGNLSALAAAGVGRLYAHVRDPRQTAVSYIHHQRWKEAGTPQGFYEQEQYDHRLQDEEIASVVEEIYPAMVQWIVDWVSASEDPNRPLDIRVDSFERMKREKDQFYVDLLQHFGVTATTQEMSQILQSMEVRANYRRGRTDEWKEAFPAQDCRIMSEMLPAELKARFNWSD